MVPNFDKWLKTTKSRLMIMSRTISKTEQYKRLILRELLECNKRKMDRTT